MLFKIRCWTYPIKGRKPQTPLIIVRIKLVLTTIINSQTSEEAPTYPSLYIHFHKKTRRISQQLAPGIPKIAPGAPVPPFIPLDPPNGRTQQRARGHLNLTRGTAPKARIIKIGPMKTGHVPTPVKAGLAPVSPSRPFIQIAGF